MLRDKALRILFWLSTALLAGYLAAIFAGSKPAVLILALLSILFIFIALGYIVVKILGAQGEARQAYGRQGIVFMILFLGYGLISFLDIKEQTAVQKQEAAVQQAAPEQYHYLLLPKKAQQAMLKINGDFTPSEITPDSHYLRFKAPETLLGKEAELDMTLRRPSNEVEQYQSKMTLNTPPDTLKFD